MKALIPTITILLFLGGCHFSTIPVWKIAEKFQTQDIHSNVPDYFPILSYATDENSAFEISRWKDRESTKFVADLDDNQVEEINRQLLLTVTDTPEKYKVKYFKIIDRTDSYVDVSLQVPTLHESHTRGWYRIQNNKITPQRYLSYGPGFAFITIPFTLLTGICCSVLFTVGVIIYNKRRKTEPAG
jgi:hypothetical protein